MGLFDAKQQLWAEEAYLDKPFTREGLREASPATSERRAAEEQQRDR